MSKNASDDDTSNIDEEAEDETFNDDDSGEAGDDDGANQDDTTTDDSGSDSGDDSADDDEGDDGQPPARPKSHIDRVTVERNYYRDIADGKNPVKPAWLKDKPAGGTTTPKSKKSDADEATLSRLEIRGVMEADDQDYVIRFAKTEGITPVEALSDPIVKDRLARNKRIREQRGSSITPNNRVGNASPKSVDSWVRKVQAGGALPSDPKLAEQVQEEMAKRSKSGRN